MATNLLLDHHLKSLGLRAFRENYPKLAEDAARSQLSYDQFCSALHERVAVLVTSNLAFSDWVSVFGNESLTAALLDRLTFRSHIFEFRGESYRLRFRTSQSPVSDALFHPPVTRSCSPDDPPEVSHD